MSLIAEFRRGTLFSRTTLAITAVSSVFLLFTLLMLALFIVVPTAQRYANTLSSMITVSAEVWQSLDAPQRERFVVELHQRYRLDIEQPPSDLAVRTRHLPFFLLLEGALAERLGYPITVQQSETEGELDRYWVALKQDGTPLYIGFEYSHLGLDPPFTLMILFLFGIGASFIAGVFLARRLTRPLNRLSRAAQRLGGEGRVEPLVEEGPLELVELERSFNRMAQQIQDLLANRTTLLAGISHDLRTPLTRMELALEMLADRPDRSLVEQMRKDIGHMNRLVGVFLEVSRGLHEEPRDWVEIGPLLDGVVRDFRRGGTELEWVPGPPCRKMIHPLALQRIVNNLLENAVRYGEGRPIELRYKVEQGAEGTTVVIEVLDRGPGIPPGEVDTVFRPFHRLEGSRSCATGGSGLGLSVVRQLSQANGCRVELLPREGGGTCARITIGATGS